MYHYDCFYICKDLTEGEINQSIQGKFPRILGTCLYQYGDWLNCTLHSRNANYFSVSPPVSALTSLLSVLAPTRTTDWKSRYVQNSSTRATGRRGAVLRQATFHTVHIPGRWRHVTYCTLQASNTACVDHRLPTYNFIHTYLFVLTVIEMQMGYIVKSNILM